MTYENNQAKPKTFSETEYYFTDEQGFLWYVNEETSKYYNTGEPV